MGHDISSVRLIDVIPNGIANYGLRLVANGRYAAFELFRSRLDALFASSLMKEVFLQRDHFDLNKVVVQFATDGQITNEWEQKCEVQTYCPEPSDVHTSWSAIWILLRQMEALRQENARLKGELVEPVGTAESAEPVNPVASYRPSSHVC